MPGLERGVLPIVCEPKQLAPLRRQGLGVPIHPAQCARHKESGGGAAAFGRKARQLVDLTRLCRRLMSARRTQTEFARQEPCAASSRTDGAARIYGKLLCRIGPSFSAQPKSPVTRRLDPFVGIVFRRAGEGEA